VVAHGLVLLMTDFTTAPLRIDFTHGKWSTLREVGDMMAKAPKPCTVPQHISNNPANTTATPL
jgi:hypothetical protein